MKSRRKCAAAMLSALMLASCTAIDAPSKKAPASAEAEGRYSGTVIISDIIPDAGASGTAALSSDTAAASPDDTAEAPPEETAAEYAPQAPEKTFSASELEQFGIGRLFYSNESGVLYFDHSCSGFSFMFDGTSISATLISDEKYCGSDTEAAWAAVYLNDSTEPYRRFPLDSPRAEYVLYESQQAEPTKITVIKLSEEQFGTAGIESLTAYGSLSPVPRKSRFIEFFGDSITAGYGNEGEYSHGFDTSEENGYMTYASIAARELNADSSMICVSGMGLVASRTCDLVAEDVYFRADAFVSDKEYDFSRQPQLITVNLGANDSYYINKDSGNYELFESKYYDLIKGIREKNPDAFILCVICDFWQARFPQIERVVDRIKSETGDGRIDSFLLPYVRRDEDYGSDGHPKIVVHEQIAKALVEKINELGIF